MLSLLQQLLLQRTEVKVALVNTGTMKKEGYFKKVLNILECRVKTRAMKSPGKRDARRAIF